MDDFRISQLQRENEKLFRQANYDELTGILNRRATERRVEQVMAQGGAYIIGDINRFKLINDTYGHLEGDRYLKRVADILKCKVRGGDVVGRIGGDEFVMFLTGCQTLEGAEHLCGRVDAAFREYNRQQNNGIELGMTVGITMYREGDTYESMYSRADQLLIQNKKLFHGGVLPADHAAESWKTDIDQIRRDLGEEPPGRGAFCQSYESFRSIYRFIERYMRRNDRKCCVILFSLEADRAQKLSVSDRETMMNRLGRILQHWMRMGDVYTRYSSCQYLVLVSDAAENDAEDIANRIRTAFAEEQQNPELLSHACYELTSVQIDM